MALVLPGLVRGDALGCGAGPFRWTVLWLKILSSDLRFLRASAVLTPVPLLSGGVTTCIPTRRVTS